MGGLIKSLIIAEGLPIRIRNPMAKLKKGEDDAKKK